MTDDQPTENAESNEPSRALVEYARSQAEKARRVTKGEPKVLPPLDLFPGYVIVDEIHRGGQGVVYDAVHEETAERVALKVLREGLFAGATDRSRFEREIQVLRQLDHAGITTIRDSGVAESHYYLVADYISGTPLDDYVKRAALPRQALLTVFADICDAVNAAHVRGVIHRDLKPGNIRIDTEGHPHVLDFGLAKLAEVEEIATTSGQAKTIPGQFIGSLPWSSPELARGDANLVDVRTDVYALGVVLYQMLTGRFPYDVLGAMGDSLHNILHEEPVRPSSISRLVDDELETIILKCLQKERDRRYGSAGELATDVRRYLDGKPIEAKGDSGWYVFRMFVGRHPTLIATIVVAFLLSVAFGAAMSVMYAQQVRVTRRAQEAEHRARGTIEYLLKDVSNGLSRLYWGEKLREEVLESAYERLQGLMVEASDHPILKADIAEAHSRLGGLAVELGRLDEAAAELDQAQSLHENLLARDPEDPDILAQYSINLVRLGNVAHARGMLDAEAPLYEKALAIDESLCERFPDNLDYKDNLSWSYERLGAIRLRRRDVQAAEVLMMKRHALARELVEAAPNDSIRVLGLCSSHHQLARLHDAKGDDAAGLTNSEPWLEAARGLVRLEPDNPRALNSLCMALASRAWRVRLQGDDRTAAECYDRALRLTDRLIMIGPDDPSFHGRRRDILVSLARLEVARNDTQAAWERLVQASESGERTVSLGARDELAWRQVGKIYRGMLTLAGRCGDSAAASKYASAADSFLVRCTRLPTMDTTALVALTDVLIGREADFEPAMAKAYEFAESAVKMTEGKTPGPLRVLANVCDKLGDVERARELLRRAREVLGPNDGLERERVERSLSLLAGKLGAGRSSP